jgi:hypothetical protein
MHSIPGKPLKNWISWQFLSSQWKAFAHHKADDFKK